jgi:zinc/manganese transport system substrate-binding protein
MRHAKLLSAGSVGLLVALLSAGAADGQTVTPASAAAQPAAAAPQNLQDVRDEIDRLKREIDALRQTYDQRLSVLEQRILVLTAGPNVPEAAPASPPVAETPAPVINLTPKSLTPSAPVTFDPPQAGGATQPTGSGAGAGASKAFNPDISVIGNFVGVAGKNPMSTQPPLQLSEAEASFQAVVDPYARADFFLSAGPEGLSVEEGFVTFTTLPAGLLLKVGKMRADFGKVNTLHTHTMPTVDRPLVTENLVGGEDGFDDSGVSVSKLVPNSFMFLDLTGGVFASDSAVFKSDERSQLSYLGRVRAYRDLTEGTNIDLGFSYAAGPGNTELAPVGLLPEAAATLHKQIMGFDATFRYRPLRRAIYKRLNVRTELIWSRQDMPVMPQQKSFGFYGLAEYQFARRWYFGGRLDRSGRTFDSGAIDKGGSVFLTYWPSEFSQIRGQYRFTQYAEGIKANEVLFQFNFASGAHGAHVFSGGVLHMRAIIRTSTAVTVLSLGVVAGPRAAGPLKVVTTTEDLASLAREVGGDKIEVTALAKGYQDPHFVDAKPSFTLALSRADLLIVVGRELEIGWLPPLQNNSRNAKVQVGAEGYLDASGNVKILEIPTGQITRAMGDVHPSGNPHYWLDPQNGRMIAQAIRDKLSQLDAADKALFAQRYSDFDHRLAAAEKRWDAAMAPYKGTKIVTYHRSWPNFMERFGLDVMGYVEPKPGIPPSPQHTFDLINEMKAQGVKLIVVEPYFDLKTPQAIANEVGGKVMQLAPSVGGTKEASDYVQLFEYDVTTLAAALKATTGK